MRTVESERKPFDRNFDTLEALADAISDVLQCPATIEDANHRLLAYSSHDPQTDPARIATIISRRVPEQVIASLWKEGVIPRLMESEKAIRISAIHDVGLGSRVAISIRKGTEIFGYIWVLEVDRQLTENEMELLRSAADAARIKLLQLQTQKFREEEGRDFLWQLLTGHMNNEEQILLRSEALGIRLVQPFVTIVFQLNRDIDRTLFRQMQYLLSTTQKVKVVMTVFFRNQFIVLAGAADRKRFEKEATDFMHSFVAYMKDRFRITPVESGGGAIYESYVDVEKSYREALTVLQIRRQFPKETSGKVLFHELGYYRFLPLLVEQKQRSGYENPCLRKLRLYDKEHGTNLLETLHVYLSENGNVKEAAESLHVHANTLTYRLKRIAEIGDIDLEHMDQKVTLYLDLKMDVLDHHK